jgi:ribulose kinase
VAGGVFTDVLSAMAAMSSPKATFDPAPDTTIRGLHETRFDAFQRLQRAAREIRHMTEKH